MQCIDNNCKNNDDFVIMRGEIYKIALECKEFEEKEIKTIKTVIPYQNLVLSDHIIKGDIKNYEKKLLRLKDAIRNKYPSICAQMQGHIDEYDSDRIVHLSALGTLTKCIISLEEPYSGGKKIFISHSSKDRTIVQNFIDHILRLGMGIDAQDIFCTSIEDLGVKNGNDIREHIRKNVQTSDFSILMISNNYKQSEICLNEMGAVWAYNNNVRYYLLPETRFDSIGWLCDTKKADAIDNPITLDALHHELMEFYKLPDNGIEWSCHRQTFLNNIVQYNKSENESPQANMQSTLKTNIAEDILNLLKNRPNSTIYEIAKTLGVSTNVVTRHMSKLLTENKITREGSPRFRRYRLS